MTLNKSNLLSTKTPFLHVTNCLLKNADQVRDKFQFSFSCIHLLQLTIDCRSALPLVFLILPSSGCTPTSLTFITSLSTVWPLNPGNFCLPRDFILVFPRAEYLGCCSLFSTCTHFHKLYLTLNLTITNSLMILSFYTLPHLLILILLQSA